MLPINISHFFLLLILFSSITINVETFAISKTITKEDIYLRTTFSAKKQREEGFTPRANVKPWPLKIPLDWGADPYNDRNWRYQLNAWRMTDPILNEYFKTKDPALIEEALEFAEDWYHYHFIEKKSHPFSWYDMAAGIRAIRIAFFLDMIQRGIIHINEERKKNIISLADIHISKLKEDKFINISNHGLFQVAGLNLLCQIASSRPACANTKDFIERKFKEIISGQFTEQGVHTENSPSYHFFVLEDILIQLKALEGISNVESIIKKAKSISPWLVFPNKKVVRVGDSGGNKKDISAFSTDAKKTCMNSGKCFLVGDLTASGYAIIRSIPDAKNQSMIFVTGMAHNLGHKHADELSFELFEFNRFIFVDSGKYGYQKDDMRNYIVSPAAHNTISLQNKVVPVKSIKLIGSYLKPIQETQDGFQIRGTVSKQPFFTQERSIFYNPGKKLRIEDIVLSTNEHTYISSLHLAPDLDPIVKDNGFRVNFKGGFLEAKLISNDCAISKIRGQQDPIIGWVSVGYLKMTPTTVIRASCPGHNRKIIWDIEFKNN